ncbi:SAM-dependent methyltransferase [Litorimonas sp. RW-G-Af-16]|uniref:SAM-dependent methyltransferase n=1 Tax=Litorimonas sp. RW-G-Af-16 TaxID=3241168 RepID=UPI00390C5B5B
MIQQVLTTQEQRDLDKFYTRPEIAQSCINFLFKLDLFNPSEVIYLEPSAGLGAFFDKMTYPKVGLDISTSRNDIMRLDFLNWEPKGFTKPVITIGNPPFGKNSSLAKKFFNHAAEFSNIIAFIVPKTFQKASLQNQLSLEFHLAGEFDIPFDSFEFDGASYSVPVVFQVWQKQVTPREIRKLPLTHPDFDFVNNELADFAFQRVGARAGMISIEGLHKSPNSHYFLKANRCRQDLMLLLKSIDWLPIKTRTAGNPSIAKSELIAAYSQIA